MDFVKREDQNTEENYKIYMENLQKTHPMEAEYQHTQLSMEQLHQAMQSTINVHTLQLPISPRQMSTLMLKTNPLSRSLNFELAPHLQRNLSTELELVHNLTNEQSHNLRHEDLLTQNINLARNLVNEIEFQNMTQTLASNLTEDLRSSDVNAPQNLRGLHLELSNELSRPNIEQQLQNQILDRRQPIVIQSVQERHVLQQNLVQIDPGLGQRLEQQRFDQTLIQRLENNFGQNLIQRLDPGLVIQDTQRHMNQGEMLTNTAIPFPIKLEQDEEQFFYRNVNENQDLNNINQLNGHHIPQEAENNFTNAPATIPENQLYSVYNNVQNLPSMNSLDLFTRANYPQNFTDTTENPENLVMNRQFENPPYTEEKLKKSQDGVEPKLEDLKEKFKSVKSNDGNKILYDYSGDYVGNEKNENDPSEHNKINDLSMNIKGEYNCYKCNKTFPSRRVLKQHSKVCLDGLGEDSVEKNGKFSCTQCSYKCQSMAILKIHERTHSGERPFSCTFCNYKSGQKNNVVKHILVHMKQKPYGCQYCEYRCAQKNNLVVHERTHTGYKPFACPYCDYRTVQKPNLVKHMYLHTDQKPFRCDVCDYRCVQKTNLTKHKQKHLNEKGDKVLDGVKNENKPYKPREKTWKCPHCTYKCVQKTSLDKHVQFKHPSADGDLDEKNGLNLMKSDSGTVNLSVKKCEQDFQNMCQDPLQIST